MLCLLLLDPTATLRSTRRASSQRFLFYHLHSEVGVESHYFLGLNNTSIIEKDFPLRSKRPRHQTDSTAFLDSSSLKLNLIYSYYQYVLPRRQRRPLTQSSPTELDIALPFNYSVNLSWEGAEGHWGIFCNFVCCMRKGFFPTMLSGVVVGGRFSGGLTCLTLSIISTLSTFFFKDLFPKFNDNLQAPRSFLYRTYLIFQNHLHLPFPFFRSGKKQ